MHFEYFRLFLFIMIGIYKITSPTGRIYIGQSIDIIKRFNGYRLVKCKAQTRLYNSFNKYGYDNHKFEVIEECEVEKLNERERYWQEYYNVLGKKGLNCRITKDSDKSGYMSEETKKKMIESMIGRKHTDETKKKFSDIRKGCGNGMFGKKHTDSTKDKMSKKGKGRFSGEKHPMYGSVRFGELNPMYGKVHSKETRLKISKSLKGKSHKGKCVLNTENGIFYDSIKTASHAINIPRTTLNAMLLGRKKNKTMIIYV